MWDVTNTIDRLGKTTACDDIQQLFVLVENYFEPNWYKPKHQGSQEESPSLVLILYCSSTCSYLLLSLVRCSILLQLPSSDMLLHKKKLMGKVKRRSMKEVETICWKREETFKLDQLHLLFFIFFPRRAFQGQVLANRKICYLWWTKKMVMSFPWWAGLDMEDRHCLRPWGQCPF